MENKCEAPIGVFDSGVGGLTVVREIMRNIPNERIVYFGDTARVPYGSKSKDTVLRYSRQIIRFLRTQEVKAIVVACNTGERLCAGGYKKGTGYPDHRCGEAGGKGGWSRHKKWQDRSDRNRGYDKFRNLQPVYPGAESGYPGDGKGVSALCAFGGGRLAEGSGDCGSSPHGICRS